MGLGDDLNSGYPIPITSNKVVGVESNSGGVGSFIIDPLNTDHQNNYSHDDNIQYKLNDISAASSGLHRSGKSWQTSPKEGGGGSEEEN